VSRWRASSETAQPAKKARAATDTSLDDLGPVDYLVVTFIVFGAVILGPLLDELTWQIVLYAVPSLTVVRMLPVALALLGTGARRPTLGFLG
jgi:sodium/hydrogen antiporter